MFSRWGALGMRLHRSATAPPVALATGVAAPSLGNGSAANGKEVEAQQPQNGSGQQAEQNQDEQQAQQAQQQQQQPRARFSDVVKAAAALKAAGSAASLNTKPDDSSSIAADDQDYGSSDAHPAAEAAEAAAAAAAAAAEAGEAGGEVAAPPRPLPSAASFSTLSVEGSQPSGRQGASSQQVGFGALPEAAGAAAAQRAKPGPQAHKSKLIRRWVSLGLSWLAAAAGPAKGGFCSAQLRCRAGLLKCWSSCIASPPPPHPPTPHAHPACLTPPPTCVQHEHPQARRPCGLAAGAWHLPGLLLLAGACQPRGHPPHARLIHAHPPRAAGWVWVVWVGGTAVCREQTLLPGFQPPDTLPCLSSLFSLQLLTSGAT